MDYPIYPEKSVAITTYYKDPDYPKKYGTHYGIDMAYQRKYYSGPKNIYAIFDGVVTECVNPSDTTSLKWLNIRHTINGQTIISRYFHFSQINVKKGDKVKKGDIIGIEGKTGVSTGSHLELQYWIVPDDYTYKAGDTKKYAVNPCDYIYLGEDQSCVYDPRKEVKEMPTYVEVPLPEGSTFTCEKSKTLWYRSTPEIKDTNKLGALPKGTYTATATVENDGYTWAKIVVKEDEDERYAAVCEGTSYLTIPKDWEVGDKVIYNGIYHYTNATAGTQKNCIGGEAYIKQVAKGKTHPYLVKHTDENTLGTVDGWVDTKYIDFYRVLPSPAYQKGDRVIFNGAYRYTYFDSEASALPATTGEGEVVEVVPTNYPHSYCIKLDAAPTEVYYWVDEEDLQPVEVKDYKELYEEEVEKNKILNEEVENLEKEVSDLRASIVYTQHELDNAIVANKTLTSRLEIDDEKLRKIDAILDE